MSIEFEYRSGGHIFGGRRFIQVSVPTPQAFAVIKLGKPKRNTPNAAARNTRDMIRHSIFLALALSAHVAAQDDAPPEVSTVPHLFASVEVYPRDSAALMTTQGTDADAEAEPEPVKCPVGGGGFQELYAVAVLLSHQDKLAEAEVCLSDAITTTVPAYRMLSDIATVNSAHISAFSSCIGIFVPWYIIAGTR